MHWRKHWHVLLSVGVISCYQEHFQLSILFYERLHRVFTSSQKQQGHYFNSENMAPLVNQQIWRSRLTSKTQLHDLTIYIKHIISSNKIFPPRIPKIRNIINSFQCTMRVNIKANLFFKLHWNANKSLVWWLQIVSIIQDHRNALSDFLILLKYYSINISHVYMHIYVG